MTNRLPYDFGDWLLLTYIVIWSMLLASPFLAVAYLIWRAFQ